MQERGLAMTEEGTNELERANFGDITTPHPAFSHPLPMGEGIMKRQVILNAGKGTKNGRWYNFSFSRRDLNQRMIDNHST